MPYDAKAFHNTSEVTRYCISPYLSYLTVSRYYNINVNELYLDLPQFLQS
jgi:hypothetical protein